MFNMNRLKDLREDKDLKQKDIAALLNIARSTYSEYEIEAKEISIPRIIKLAIFYNTSADYIFYRTDNILPYRRNKVKYIGNENNLKSLRLKQIKTQKVVALDMNIPLKSYIKYENASTRINIQLMKSFAEYYKTSIDHIIGLTDETKPHKKSNIEWDNISKEYIIKG